MDLGFVDWLVGEAEVIRAASDGDRRERDGRCDPVAVGMKGARPAPQSTFLFQVLPSCQARATR